ncbi:MAG TPA: peptidoglycan DD-metalloendopeptidase family protein [Caulobacterales bacterium]|nr:peptidoglycan DD-metalloendopeptidase family protein [Caulobacterales bacterium]
MKRAVPLALLLAGCAASAPAPISYGGGPPRARAPQAASAEQPPRSSPQPNWAEGEGTPLSAYALQPAATFDPRHPPRTHRVEAHQSLTDIAAIYHLPLMALIEQNHLEPPYHVRPGATIELPPPNLHRVERNETFESIAERYNVQPHSLAILNALQPPYSVREGDQIVLPAEAVAWRNPEPSPASTAPPARSPAAQSGASANVRFVWPVRGALQARFGAQSDGRRLDGVEIAAPRGAPVGAAADGDVVYAGSDLPSYGTLILIRHAEGYVTAYGYAQNARVREGQHVRAGEQIAEVGQVRGAPRLMFQVRQGRNAIDPLPMLGGG